MEVKCRHAVVLFINALNVSASAFDVVYDAHSRVHLDF